MKLIVATSYFPVSSDIRSNTRNIVKQMRHAKAQGAHVIHFPEGALSGYAGVDFKSYVGFDWRLLKEATEYVIDEARSIRIWLVLGSTHRLSGSNKPHNSLYIVNDRGKITDRYDKLFCAGPQSGKSDELAHYSSGNHFCVFMINGIRCGTLICHDCRYPELYRQYKQRGVQLMFHSYHAGHMAEKIWKEGPKDLGEAHAKLNKTTTVAGIVFPATMQSMAANTFMWISYSNTSARQSCFPAFFVRPDGLITSRLRRNVAGVLINAVDPNRRFYDSTIAWRDRAMRGIYHSGKLVRDKRSTIRTQL